MPSKELKSTKPKILILCDYYLPGYKSGGGMRTIVNMVERFYKNYDFWIITRDHDGKLDQNSYQTIKINDWNNVQNAKVYYLSKDKVKMSNLRELIIKCKPDVLYFNSYFSTLTILALLLHKLKLIYNCSKIVAPCGELSDGGLSLKQPKKKLFLKFAKLSGIYQKVIWKASSNLEKDEIERVSSSNAVCFIAPDIVPKQILAEFNSSLKPRKISGKARLVFLSRFTRKKNFKFLLENLTEVKGDLLVDVWGPLEDLAYWEECIEIIKTLPSNVTVELKGSIPFESVAAKLLEYHFFVLPTLGENFGHVFVEALAAGCPLLISDQTPWTNLAEKKIGWDITLTDIQKWRVTINQIIDLNDDSYIYLSGNARKFAEGIIASRAFVKDTKKVIEFALTNTLNKML